MNIPEEKLHEIAVLNKPKLHILPTSTWIAILYHTKSDARQLSKKNDIRDQSDFFWLKCHRNITVRTLKAYYMTSQVNECIILRHGDEVPEELSRVEDLRACHKFGDNVIVLRAIEFRRRKKRPLPIDSDEIIHEDNKNAMDADNKDALSHEQSIQGASITSRLDAQHPDKHLDQPIREPNLVSSASLPEATNTGLEIHQEEGTTKLNGSQKPIQSDAIPLGDHITDLNSADAIGNFVNPTNLMHDVQEPKSGQWTAACQEQDTFIPDDIYSGPFQEKAYDNVMHCSAAAGSDGDAQSDGGFTSRMRAMLEQEMQDDAELKNSVAEDGMQVALTALEARADDEDGEYTEG